MNTARLDDIRSGAIARMERAERNVRLAVFGAAIIELGLFVIAIMIIDFSDRIERLMFILAVLSYTIVALGLAALGAHVTRSVGRVVAALDSMR